jgi:TP901 family phage tail tape measure protein
MSSAVLSLAGPTATAPDELAKGLYHIESTGFRGAKALQILKVAAEGAKIGGADLEDVTNALNAAVASGIPGVQNMSQAMGALNAVVGSGDMRMQDLADALGTGVLSVVKGFGLSLNDVGAALATFGDNNIRGADAATALRMAVMSLAKPAAGGADAIDKLGLQSDTLAKAMQRGGLNAALTLLHDRLKATGNTGNKVGLVLTEAFGKKAGIGLQVLEDQFARFQSKVEEVGKGAKGFDASWAATTKTFSYRFDAMRAAVDALGIRIGTVLLPVASDLIVAITGIGKAASTTVGFLKNHQTAVEALAAVYAATLIPKLVMLAVAQARVIGEDIAIRFMYARDAATKFAGSLTPLKIGLIAVAIAAIDVFNSWRSIDSAVKDARQSLKDAANVGNYSSFTDFASNAESQYQQLTATADTMYAHLSANPFANLSTAVNAYSGHLADARGKIIDAAAAQRQLVGNVEAVTQALGAVPTSGNMQQTFEVMQRALADNAISVDDLTGNWQTLRDKLQGYIVTSGGTTNATKAVANAIIGLQSPAKDAQAAIDDLTTAFKGLVNAPISADEAAAKFIADLQALDRTPRTAAPGRSACSPRPAGTTATRSAGSPATSPTSSASGSTKATPSTRSARSCSSTKGPRAGRDRVHRQQEGRRRAAPPLAPAARARSTRVAGALQKSVGKAAAAKKGGEKAGAALSEGVRAGQLAKHQALDRAVDMTTPIKTGGGKAAAAAKQTGTRHRLRPRRRRHERHRLAAAAGPRLRVQPRPGRRQLHQARRRRQVPVEDHHLRRQDDRPRSHHRLRRRRRQGLRPPVRSSPRHCSTSSPRHPEREVVQGLAARQPPRLRRHHRRHHSGVGVKTYLKAKLNDLRKFAHDLAGCPGWACRRR